MDTHVAAEAVTTTEGGGEEKSEGVSESGGEPGGTGSEHEILKQDDVHPYAKVGALRRKTIHTMQSLQDAAGAVDELLHAKDTQDSFEYVWQTMMASVMCSVFPCLACYAMGQHFRPRSQELYFGQDAPGAPAIYIFPGELPDEIASASGGVDHLAVAPWRSWNLEKFGVTRMPGRQEWGSFGRFHLLLYASIFVPWFFAELSVPLGHHHEHDDLLCILNPTHPPPSLSHPGPCSSLLRWLRS